MCGGAGTRLWPASREGRPKQFLPLFGAHSTFQDTLHRVADPHLFGRPIVVTNAQYRFLVAEQLAEIGVEVDILLEPVRRDSGPAIAAGAAFAAKRDDDPVVVALAADHVISDPAAFAKV
jgi:mannose-1-phosphate guanylyltransferase / mannose-6-phosphate isomerase